MRSLVPGRDFRTPEVIKKFAAVFVTVSDDFLFCFGFVWKKKNVCAIPVRMIKDQY